MREIARKKVCCFSFPCQFSRNSSKLEENISAHPDKEVSKYHAEKAQDQALHVCNTAFDLDPNALIFKTNII